MKILVVEDEPKLHMQLVNAIEGASWVAESANNGIDALHFIMEGGIDAVVLDLGLPKLDGLTVLRTMREQGVQVPVIILSARDTLHDRIEGLNAGADDYLCKPFQMAELIVRLQVQLRRGSGHASPMIQVGALSLDTRTSAVQWQGVTIKLTALEFKVLSYLMHNQGESSPEASSPSIFTDRILIATPTPLRCLSSGFVKRSTIKSSRQFED